jgi:hypothetical protein
MRIKYYLPDVSQVPCAVHTDSLMSGLGGRVKRRQVNNIFSLSQNFNYRDVCRPPGSVADPGCLSRILIFTHPGSRIPDLGSKNSNKREG